MEESMQIEDVSYGHVTVHTLCEAFLALCDEKECLAFLLDIMTVREIQDLMQRLCVASLLTEGKPYTRISEEVSVSSATISRVNRALTYGSGGYQTVLNRLDLMN